MRFTTSRERDSPHRTVREPHDDRAEKHGITIGDTGSFSQAAIARTRPGDRLPGPAQVGVLTRNGEVVLGFGSMGIGMHHRPFQGLLNFARFGMSIDEAVGAPDFFASAWEPETGELVIRVPQGRFPREVLEATGYRYQEKLRPLMPGLMARASGWASVETRRAGG